MVEFAGPDLCSMFFIRVWDVQLLPDRVDVLCGVDLFSTFYAMELFSSVFRAKRIIFTWYNGNILCRDTEMNVFVHLVWSNCICEHNYSINHVNLENYNRP